MKTFAEKIVTRILDIASKHDLNYSEIYDFMLEHFYVFRNSNQKSPEELHETAIKIIEPTKHRTYDIRGDGTHYNKDMNVYDQTSGIFEKHVLAINHVASEFLTNFKCNGILVNLFTNFRDAILREDYEAVIAMREELIKYWDITEPEYFKKMQDTIDEAKDRINFLIKDRKDDLYNSVGIYDNGRAELIRYLDIISKDIERGDILNASETVNMLMDFPIAFYTETISALKFAIDIYLDNYSDINI